ncbi:TRAP transporter small permease [Enterovibrio norvegicus]|uniref:TRAP transporter small permease n=1 Tax=Enterovibrio norvegicus TaxID=188144 RepID=UPI000C8574A1|nr:TRAP transporter small permease [Enterovibrio norvegicus]PML81872.1 C4-dicarboxylate ABC transporter [Enterovibrio norvegicus]
MPFVLTITRYLRHALAAITALSLFAMLLVTVIDVVGRYFFSVPLAGSVEMVEILLALVVFSAFPLITWSEEHICVDLLDDWFPEGVARVRQVLLSLGCAFALGLVAWKVWGLGARSLSYGEETDVLGIPNGFVMYFISVAGWFSMVLTLLMAGLYATGKNPASFDSADNNNTSSMGEPL